MNDLNRTTIGQPPTEQQHTSEQEAVRITQQDDVPELNAFIQALNMSTPVSTDKAARLLKHMVKEQMATDGHLIADQMRADGWEADLSGKETLAVLAERALAYLSTHEGISLFNFFVKTFARTSGKMFE